MTANAGSLRLFEAFGVELEYMIVDRDTLDVRPIADQLLTRANGELTSEFDDGRIRWSNELALHVIELKTNGPARSLVEAARNFRDSLDRLREFAAASGARLMPTAMHPWMDPATELRLWPHDCNEIYQAYNRIFDCRGHGWANLQSMHINLPFADDDEFGRLHAAIRLVLPILPAIAASSPIADRRETGYLDYRMEVYRNNSAKLPSIAGLVIPEAVFTQADYEERIFNVAYREIAPFDPAGILQHPFLNSRGAIARFERGAIEIRVIDVQECPEADLAIAEVVTKLVRLLVSESLVPYPSQQRIETERLSDIFLRVIREADRAVIQDRAYLEAFGVSSQQATANEVWTVLLPRLVDPRFADPLSPTAAAILDRILERGPLARRILTAAQHDMSRLPSIYAQLCDCLEQGRLYAT